ncbi:anti-sigma factor antagonist [Streptomyces longwoodensis]|uniref:anti-sigma factor antagonist n=1 Tax=Streptomyces longwoodensis TaxID=68231 RepID=UPI0036F5E42F
MHLSIRPDRSHIRTYRSRGHTVIELRGEIDIAAMAEITPIVDAATEAATPSVVVSLLDVDFFDCSGLRLLCRARRRVEERDGQVALVCRCPLILRILRLFNSQRLSRSSPPWMKPLTGQPRRSRERQALAESGTTHSMTVPLG